MSSSTSDNSNKLIDAYYKMLERVYTFIEEAEDSIEPKIYYAIESAKEKASELEELTLEEAELIGQYLKKDLSEAADYISEEGQELRDWFRFDVELIEDRLLDVFSSVVNTTQMELQEWADLARQGNYWATGDITGPGSLQCTECNEVLNFEFPASIPECPKCGNLQFQRNTG